MGIREGIGCLRFLLSREVEGGLFLSLSYIHKPFTRAFMGYVFGMCAEIVRLYDCLCVVCECHDSMVGGSGREMFVPVPALTINRSTKTVQ